MIRIYQNKLHAPDYIRRETYLKLLALADESCVEHLLDHVIDIVRESYTSDQAGLMVFDAKFVYENISKITFHYSAADMLALEARSDMQPGKWGCNYMLSAHESLRNMIPAGGDDIGVVIDVFLHLTPRKEDYKSQMACRSREELRLSAP